jgi:hypothetical protein
VAWAKNARRIDSITGACSERHANRGHSHADHEWCKVGLHAHVHGIGNRQEEQQQEKGPDYLVEQRFQHVLTIVMRWKRGEDAERRHPPGLAREITLCAAFHMLIAGT